MGIFDSGVLDLKKELQPYIDTDEKFESMNANEKIDLLNEVFRHRYARMFEAITGIS